LKVLSEKFTDSSVEITLEQSWFLADGSVPSAEEEATALWSVPLTFATSQQTTETAVIMSKKVQTFVIPLSGADDWIKINSGQKALVRVAHSTEMTRRLSPALRNKTLTPVDRAALLLDAFALAKAGFAPIENVVDILRNLDTETSSIVWAAISGVLSALNIQLEQVGGVAYDSFLEFGKKAVTNALAFVGWDAKPTDGHTDKLLRTTVIGLLDTFAWNDATVLAESRRRYDGHWEDASLLPSEYKTTVYKIILANGGEKEYEEVLKTFYATTDNAEKRFAFALGATPSVALKLRTLDWAIKSGDIKTQDFFYPIGPVAGCAAGAQLTWDYFKQVCVGVCVGVCVCWY